MGRKKANKTASKEEKKGVGRGQTCFYTEGCPSD